VSITASAHLELKGKGKGDTLDIAFLFEGTSLQKRSSIARVVDADPSVAPHIEQTMPAFAFSATKLQGFHFPTHKGWKAELA